MGPEPTSVSAWVRVLTFSNIYISETSGPITIKFYLKQHWGSGKAALGFGADRYRTLVSLTIGSSHGENAVSTFLGIFYPFFILANSEHMHVISDEFEI